MKYNKPNSHKLNTIEIIVFTIIWTIVFSIPFFQQQSHNTINWQLVFNEWIRMFAILIIFIFNINVLVPNLLFKKKYFSFISFTLLLIIATTAASVALRFYLMPLEPLAMPPMNLGPGMPPMELGSKMPAPMGYRLPEVPETPSLLMQFINNFIISVLVVGASIAFKMMTQWLNEEDRRKDLQKEQLKTELALLRHQVSPHFLMNTLNNIHALVDINTASAKDAIIRLSTLMRYLLYDSAQGQTSLKKEIEFIESYITLMQLRFSKKINITVEVPETLPDIQIPPMLFISFIENAFKHGVSYQADSYVFFKLQLINTNIYCTIKNSKHKAKNEFDKAYSGIGLSNIQKSLELLYHDNYTLVIDQSETDFEVKLSIPTV